MRFEQHVSVTQSSKIIVTRYPRLGTVLRAIIIRLLLAPCVSELTAQTFGLHSLPPSAPATTNPPVQHERHRSDPRLTFNPQHIKSPANRRRVLSDSPKRRQRPVPKCHSHRQAESCGGYQRPPAFLPPSPPPLPPAGRHSETLHGANGSSLSSSSSSSLTYKRPLAVRRGEEFSMVYVDVKHPERRRD